MGILTQRNLFRGLLLLSTRENSKQQVLPPFYHRIAPQWGSLAQSPLEIFLEFSLNWLQNCVVGLQNRFYYMDNFREVSNCDKSTGLGYFSNDSSVKKRH